MGILNPLPMDENDLPPRPHLRFVANPWGQGPPGDPAVLHAAHPNPGMPPRILRFQDLMRYPRPPPPPPAGPPANYWRNVQAAYRPENLAAEVDRQIAQVAAGHEAVVEQDIAQTIAARRAAAQQQIAQAAAGREAVILQRVRAGLRRPNFAVPGVPQPPARNDQPADGLAAAALNEAVLLRRRVEQRRGLDPERDMQAHLARIKEAAHNYENNNDEQRRRRNHEQLERIQILQNKAGAIDRDNESLRQLKERLDRLRQRADNINQSDANGEAMAPNELPRRPGSLRLRRRQPDPPAPALPQPAEVLRQQQILDHAERDLERSQQMARLRRDQEIDAAVTARNLARIRKNNAPASGPARQPQETVVLPSSPEQPRRKTNISDPANEADDEEEREEEDDEDWL